MQTEEIKKEIDKAADNEGRLLIEGYKDSKGNVTTKTVRLLGEGEGYHTLVQESLDELDSVTNPGFDEDVWTQAKEELRASFRKTLDGTHTPRKSNITYEDVPGHKYILREGNTDEIVLRGMIQEDSKIVESNSESKPNKAEKTKAKDALRKALPIGDYLGMLVITKDKVDSVKAI